MTRGGGVRVRDTIHDLHCPTRFVPGRELLECHIIPSIGTRVGTKDDESSVVDSPLVLCNNKKIYSPPFSKRKCHYLNSFLTR